MVAPVCSSCLRISICTASFVWSGLPVNTNACLIFRLRYSLCLALPLMECVGVYYLPVAVLCRLLSWAAVCLVSLGASCSCHQTMAVSVVTKTALLIRLVLGKALLLSPPLVFPCGLLYTVPGSQQHIQKQKVAVLLKAHFQN